MDVSAPGIVDKITYLKKIKGVAEAPLDPPESAYEVRSLIPSK